MEPDAEKTYEKNPEAPPEVDIQIEGELPEEAQPGDGIDPNTIEGQLTLQLGRLMNMGDYPGAIVCKPEDVEEVKATIEGIAAQVNEPMASVLRGLVIHEREQAETPVLAGVRQIEGQFLSAVFEDFFRFLNEDMPKELRVDDIPIVTTPSELRLLFLLDCYALYKARKASRERSGIVTASPIGRGLSNIGM